MFVLGEPASVLSLAVTTGATGKSTWVAKLSAAFGSRTLTGSVPIVRDDSGQPASSWFAVMPDSTGGKVVNGNWTLHEHTGASPDLIGSFLWWDGPVETPAELPAQVFDFHAIKVK
jgi:hypothetical protein